MSPITPRTKNGRVGIFATILLVAGCGSASEIGTSATEGFDSGATGSGGNGGVAPKSSGGRNAGGVASAGGGIGAGGRTNASGGANGGGVTAAGGSTSTGGTANTGGSTSAGGASSTGGTANTGGASSTGGTGTGGTSSSGGAGGTIPLDAGADGASVSDASVDGRSLDGARDADGAVACDGGTILGAGQGKKRVFTTKEKFKGDLVAAANDQGGSVTNGLDAGDALCNHAAAAAGLGGTWMAWLSSSTANAIDRIADVGPWYRLDGPKVFENKAALLGNPLASLAVNEACTLSDLANWTGTLADGTVAANTCNDWTSSASDVHGLCGFPADTHWSAGTVPLCNNGYYLYCFEQ